MTDRRLYLRAWLRAMTVLEQQLRVDQARARNAMIRASATSYEKNGHPPAHVYLDHRTRVKGVIEDHYRRTIPVFGQMALKQVKSRRIEKKAAQTIYESLVADWISRESLRKATMIADTDRQDVQDAIDAGMAEGLGTEEIGRRIRKVTQMTPFRAATVARTETHAAATFGSIESVRQAERDLGVVMVKEWLATRDDRTRPEHLAADGQKVAMDEKFTVGGESMDRPGDTGASGANTVNCLHPDSVIQSGCIKAMTRHWYEGNLVTIETASGNKLTVTPNHPILTRHGWVIAALLNEGSGVVCSTGGDGPLLHGLDIKNIETTAEQVYNSLSVVGMVVRVAGVNVNFHGERPNGDVDVVWPTSELRNRIVATVLKPLRHFRLARTDFAQGRLLAYRLLYGVRVVELGRHVANRFMGLLGQAGTLLKRGVCHALIHAFTAVPRLNAVIFKTQADVATVSAERQGQLLDRFTGEESPNDFGRMLSALSPRRNTSGLTNPAEHNASTLKPTVDSSEMNAMLLGKLREAEARKVFLDKVLVINHIAYSGYVYNLETRNGYYICNGIVQHNCRCAIVYEEA